LRARRRGRPPPPPPRRPGREREATVHVPPPHLASPRLLTVIEWRVEGGERRQRRDRI
jgi:hypothetical protein